MHTRQSVAAVPQNKINLSKTIVESTLIALDRMRSRGLPEDTIEQLDLLPFVATSSSDGDRFWKVETTGDYCLDVELGQAYGSIYLQYSQMGGDLSLYWIIESMEFTGTEFRQRRSSWVS